MNKNWLQELKTDCSNGRNESFIILINKWIVKKTGLGIEIMCWWNLRNSLSKLSLGWVIDWLIACTCEKSFFFFYGY